jgi:serine protease SohB
MLFDVGSFSLKALVLGLVITTVLLILISASLKQKRADKNLDVQDLSEKNKKRQLAIRSKLMPAGAFKKLLKEEKKKLKEEKKAQNKSHRPRLFVLDFKGDVKASQGEDLRDQISALVSVCEPSRDEVLVSIESPGGMVHTYGLAAAQLHRLRARGIRLTAAVDKVAASGGYLMASVAHEIIAAPFAVVGSIGVVAQVPNFHRLLKKNDIDYQEITSGKFKRTVSLLGEITPEGKKHFEQKIEGTHVLFKDFVKELRPQLNLEEVANGDHWYGSEALRMGLVDRLLTSDDYILEALKTKQVIKISTPEKKTLMQKMSQAAEAGLEKCLERFFFIG